MRALRPLILGLALGLMASAASQRSKLADAKPRRRNSRSVSDTRRNWRSARVERQERATQQDSARRCRGD